MGWMSPLSGEPGERTQRTTHSISVGTYPSTHALHHPAMPGSGPSLTKRTGSYSVGEYS